MDDHSLDPAAEELQALRHHVRDLAALVALPALWRGMPRSFIASSLVDVLRNILQGDVAYVRLVDSSAGEAPVEVHWPHAPAGAVQEACRSWLGGDASTPSRTVADPFQPGVLHLAILRPSGLVAGEGVVLVGARREGFPNPRERYLLQVAVGQATISINDAELLARERRARAEALEAVRLRDEFLSVASHELKTPLTPLQLKLQGLRRLARREDTSPEALREHIHRAVEGSEVQVHRLANLINQLLDVSRLSRGTLALTPEDVDLAVLAREVASELAPQARQAGCRIDFHAPAHLLGRWDRLRLEQVMTNLLTNAIKYGAGSPVSITLEAGEGGARLIVRDEGIGIAPEHLSRIFEKFERAVSERHYGGLGLGLYITRQIVEAMGGTIRVQSAPGRGASFLLELPHAAGSREG